MRMRRSRGVAISSSACWHFQRSFARKWWWRAGKGSALEGCMCLHPLEELHEPQPHVNVVVGWDLCTAATRKSWQRSVRLILCVLPSCASASTASSKSSSWLASFRVLASPLSPIRRLVSGIFVKSISFGHHVLQVFAA